MVREGIWTKGKKTIEGRWQYLGSDKFAIRIFLKQRDWISGRATREFDVYGDSPEFNGWKLIRE